MDVRTGNADRVDQVRVGPRTIAFDIVGHEGPWIVLVHGNRAHRGWWHATLPELAASHRVIAVDLSGHGESTWAPPYDRLKWADEVLAVMNHLKVPAAVLAGHSQGGHVAVAVAGCAPARVAGVVTLDTAVLDPKVHDRMFGQPPRAPRVYADRQSAIDAFRLLPAQAPPASGVLATVAEAAVHKVESGWTYRWDPAVMASMHVRDAAQGFQELTTPLRFVYGEASTITTEEVLNAARHFCPHAEFVGAPGAHHLPLDTPDGTARAVAEAAARWQS